ncbi:Transforming growth factor beta receptor type 3 [Anabarilius grahami]|uniref:Transforming growth factor beta receptor type 3 n=1 Tax=Anabarilius grahami TaxID=495550 RepID=A0A3N0XEG5_ANAGA|nr:Transforming growth factor beta receptor type 3 [Anabarilius grahami]
MHVRCADRSAYDIKVPCLESEERLESGQLLMLLYLSCGTLMSFAHRSAQVCACITDALQHRRWSFTEPVRCGTNQRSQFPALPMCDAEYVALHLRPIQSLQMHQKPLVFVLNSPQPVLWKLRTEKLVSGVKRIFHHLSITALSLSLFLSFLHSIASEPTPSTFSQQ